MSSEPSVSTETCFDISDSKVFPEFNGYRVAPIPKAGKPPGTITTTKDLDSYASLLMQNDPSKMFNCQKKDDIDQLRYFYSVYFFQYIAYSGVSCNNTRTPQICKSSADAAQQKFQEIIKVGECQPPPSVLRSMNITFEGTSNDCITGFGDEVKQCGFIKADSATKYCSVNSSDKCCKLLAVKSPSTTNNNGLIIGLSTGIVLFFLMVGIIIWIYNRNKLRRISQSSNDNDTMKVVQAYKPVLVDEIQLNEGDIIIVKAKFDDGWGFGINITSENEGSFPMNCLDVLDSKLENLSKPKTGAMVTSSRESSLNSSFKAAKTTKIDIDPISETHTELDNDGDLVLNTMKMLPSVDAEPQIKERDNPRSIMLNTVKISAAMEKGLPDIKMKNNRGDLFLHTVKITPTVDKSLPEVRRKFSQGDLSFNTVKLSPFKKIKDEILSQEKAAESSMPQVETETEKLTTVDSLSKSPVTKSPSADPTTASPFDSVKIMPAGQLPRKKAPRKFGTESLKYGTIKSNANLPGTTATFNDQFKATKK